MDILKRPGSLSLSGNMDRIVVSTNRELLFVLRDSGGAAIVENSYAPNDQNRMEIDVKSIVTPLLSLTLKNVSNPYQQTKIAQTFTAELSEVVDAIPQNTQTITFTVIRAGVDELADSVENFLEQNFLTWQPNMKPVTYYSPEFLTYYAVTAATMKCQATMEDGTTAELTLASIPAGECVYTSMQSNHMMDFDEIGSKHFYTYNNVSQYVIINLIKHCTFPLREKTFFLGREIFFPRQETIFLPYGEVKVDRQHNNKN